jgi:tetratricopeptide (TPR) repeat protein
MDSPRPFRWQLCVVAACLFGVATKEVMATAPFLVLLYDRTFAAGSFRQALRQRRWMYLGLAATWIPLAWLVARTGWNRGGSAGFFGPVAPWEYWLTQFEAVTRYLWLSVWPHPLVFEYGPLWVHQFAATAICAFVVGSLAVATIVALWRWPVWGFLGAWFFVILAPTSVVPIANQWIVEYRMYLPLAAVMTLVALGIRAATGRQSWTLLALLVLVLGVHTSRRNEDYRSDLAIWTDTVAKRPENVVAQVNLGLSLEHAGLIQEAMQHYAEALRIDPNLVQAHIDLGNLLFGTQRTSEAIRQYAIALTISPNDAQTHHGLGVILDQVGRTAEAIQHYTEALRLNPDLVNAHNNLGVDLCDCGRVAEAIAHFKEALRLRSDYAEARNNLGNALVQAGRIDEAVAEYEEVMRLRPDDPDARRVLGLIRTGRLKKPAPGN